jgi:uncharacterized membrane protein
MECSGPSSAGVAPEEAMERWLGGVLRIGVIVATALVLLGLASYVAGGQGHDRTALDAALGRRTAIRPLHAADILSDLRDGEPPALIQLGLLALILTPVARVALTVLLFKRQRDWPFVGLSGVVLLVLVLGLFGIGA